MANLDREHLEKEFAPFLIPSARLDVKGIAVEYFLGLSGEASGKEFVGSSDKFLEGFVSLLQDEHEDIVKKTFQTLINLSTVEATCLRLLNLPNCPNLGRDLVTQMLDPDNKVADYVCQLLSNMTRNETCARKISDMVLQEDQGINKIVMALCDTQHNKQAMLHHLAAVLGNLTQIRDVRLVIMSRKQYVIQRLLPFIEYKQSSVRRHGVLTVLKNCCFDSENHDWLLGEQVDLLPRLLLPLAGPEEFDEDDTEKLPDDLQYLPPEKTRESDPEIRRMLVETIFKLCNTKKCRQYIKEKNTYVILREYHKWEEDRRNYPAIMNLIDVLIGDEPEPGMEDLEQVEIPENVQEKFQKMDEDIAKQEAETSTENPSDS